MANGSTDMAGGINLALDELEAVEDRHVDVGDDEVELGGREAAQGVDAVRLFLTLMIAHHQGGVEMAEAVLARTDVPQVVSLATGIERAQQAEIVAMRELLAQLPA